MTTSTLRHLENARRNGEISVQRFRANIVIDSGPATGLVENAWIGRTLSVGGAKLRVTIPCPRCVMPTLARSDLPSDPTLLRLIAQTNTLDLGEIGRLPCAGVYADVIEAGEVRRGDQIRMLD